MFVLYGMPLSPRSRKAHWALEEAGARYEYVAVDIRKGETHTPAFLRINPAGTVPALVHGEVTLCEANAIVLYVAEQAGGAIALGEGKDRAATLQALFWDASSLGEPLHSAWLAKFRAAAGQPFDADAWERAAAAAKGPLATLDAQLGGGAYVAGERFGAGDVAVGASIAQCAEAGIDLGPYPHVARWFAEVAARPAFRATHPNAHTDGRAPATPPERA